MITAGVGFDDARIDREARALDETGVHARPNHRLEDLPEDVALPESAMTIDRERRMIGNLVVEIEATEPAIGEVEVDFFDSFLSERIP